MLNKVAVLLLLFCLSELGSATVINQVSSCVLNVSSSSSLSWCYQEMATVAICGSSTAGTYLASPNYIYINYTKPAYATNNSRWLLGHANVSDTGRFTTGWQGYYITLPTHCWNVSATNIQLRIYSNLSKNGTMAVFNAQTQPQCYNGTAWQNVGLLYNSSESAGANPGVSPSTAAYDGLWYTGTTYSEYNSSWMALSNTNASIFEEAMNWSVETINQAYNITFREEVNGSLFNFSKHNSSSIDIICPNYGTDNFPLTDSTLLFSTRETPYYLNMKLDSNTQVRKRVIMSSTGNYSVYLLDTPGITYKLSLLDYSNLFGNSILILERSVNGSLVVVHSEYWDFNQQAWVYLYNNTPYRFSVTTPSASRILGYISLQSDDTNKIISIQSVDLNRGNVTKFAGGLSMWYDVSPTGVFIFWTNKSSGYISSLVLNISYMNVSNYSIVYTFINSSSSGAASNIIVNFTLPNVNGTYSMDGVLVTDSGFTLPISVPFSATPTYRLIDLHFSQTYDLFGVAEQTIYSMLATGLLILGFISLSKVDAGFGFGIGSGMGGFIMLIFALFLQLVGWLRPMNLYWWGFIGLIAIVWVAGEKAFKRS